MEEYNKTVLASSEKYYIMLKELNEFIFITFWKDGPTEDVFS